jgi:hypothetical protein
MTFRYFYSCNACGHNYIEQRLETELQYIVICNSCRTGSYQLQKEVQLEEPVIEEPIVITELPIE